MYLNLKRTWQKGIKVKYSSVLDDIISRDKRDMERDVSPLVVAEDAFLIDSSNLEPTQVLDIAIKYIFRDDKVWCIRDLVVKTTFLLLFYMNLSF